MGAGEGTLEQGKCGSSLHVLERNELLSDSYSLSRLSESYSLNQTIRQYRDIDLLSDVVEDLDPKSKSWGTKRGSQ